MSDGECAAPSTRIVVPSSLARFTICHQLLVPPKRGSQGRSPCWEIPQQRHLPTWDNKISRADIQMSAPNSEQSFPSETEGVRHVL